jgi:hypothetical protein
MALNATVLSAVLKPTLKAAFVAVGAEDNAALETFMTSLANAIATAVVAHITSAGTLVVVTTCGAGAGTGTGTIV